MSCNILVDVVLCGEVLRVAAYVDCVRGLIHSDVVHPHVHWEWEIFQVHKTEISRHAEIRNHILEVESVQCEYYHS